MQRMSDATILRWMELLPILVVLGLVLGGTVIVGLMTVRFDPVVFLALAAESFLGIAVGLIRREAAKRAGGPVGIEAWRASNGWVAPEFRITHDYDPEGSDFQELLRILGDRGYTVSPNPAGIAHGSSWQFRRAVA